MASIMSEPSSDRALLETTQALFKHSGRITALKSGSTMFEVEDEQDTPANPWSRG